MVGDIVFANGLRINSIIDKTTAPGKVAGCTSLLTLKPPRACFPSGGGTDAVREHSIQTMKKLLLRGQDSNLWPQGYDPCELPFCSTTPSCAAHAHFTRQR